MSKLHEVLAVERDRKKKAASILNETLSVFNNKKEHFDGFRKNFVRTDDDAPQLDAESRELVTSVREKLTHTFQSISDSLNLTLSKEETNSKGNAYAELNIGSKTYNLSATSLLALENQLGETFNLLKAIPTLDNTAKWVADDDRDDVKKLETPEKQYKTQKKSRVIVLYNATPEHPAQVTLQPEDVQIGYWETYKTTGKFTPREKTDILARIETLLESVKTARARANTVAVEDVQIASEVYDYILNGGQPNIITRADMLAQKIDKFK